MTDSAIAGLMRELAADLRDPLSAECITCRAAAGEPCTVSEVKTELHNGVHPLRPREARLRAEGAAIRMLVNLSREGT